MAPSVSLVLTPRVSRSQSGVAAAMHALMTDRAPKILIVPHSRPAAPLLPSTKDSAVVEPIRAVRAAISMRPPPKFKEETVEEVREVALDMVTGVEGAPRA